MLAETADPTVSDRTYIADPTVFTVEKLLRKRKRQVLHSHSAHYTLCYTRDNNPVMFTSSGNECRY